MKFRIPVYQPSLTGHELAYVQDCVQSNWISSIGDYVSRFENEFATYTSVRHAATTCNGTAALHLALVALGLAPGDEVIVPTLTYVASVNAISYTGATPVFADSSRDTWQLDFEDVLRKLTPKTRAIMAVHLYGHPCDMDPLVHLCRERGLFLVEDCAEALGASYKGHHVGSFGHIAIYSFYGNKTITTGEGGMVVTNDETLHARTVRFRGQGLAAHRQYWHDVVGYNYRMTNICAALGLAQLEQADVFLARKRELAKHYRERLSAVGLEFQGEADWARHAHWMCSALVPEAFQRDPLRAHLAESGIETRPVFYPVHTMPMYSQRFQRHVVAEDLGWRGLSLPSWPGLSDSQVEEVCDRICDFVR